MSRPAVPTAAHDAPSWRGRLRRLLWLPALVALATACNGGAQAGDRAEGTERTARTERSARSAPPAGTVAPAGATVADTSAARGFGPEMGFRSPQRLREHFEKHGGEFAAASAGEYLRQAQQLRDAPLGEAVRELRRGDGSISRFDRSTGAFLAFDADGTIRTFFRPNDGEAYFRRQARRRSVP